MSTVDVVIPCYNYGRYLRGCVASVLSQTEANVRVLVIDDASSDDTAQIGQELAASNRKVEFRRHEVNKGHIATYNEGLIGWSTADYTVLLSADDMLTPGSLGRAAPLWRPTRTSAWFTVERFISSRRQSSQESALVSTPTNDFPEPNGWKARCRAGHNVISSPEVVVRGKIQRAVGGYCAELPHAGDLEMWMRIAAISSIAYVRRIPQAFYRVHAASMQRTKYRSSLRDLRQRKTAFTTFFQQYRHVVTDAEHMHDMANRALAREALWDACRAYDRDQLEQTGAHELVEFALTTYPKASSLPEYAQLRRRQRLGPVICKRTQLFVLSALVRKVERWRSKQRWKRRGI